ncbi:hypothetical protein ACFO0A_05190 [Novosphingobium tardum]|uniref:Porin n=1 Tax=Novosphingobium tardum TaxID=1538021 RepID=A0ABV8RM34_9SPHN
MRVSDLQVSVRRRVLGTLLAGGALVGLLVAPEAGNAFSSGFDSHPVSLAARGGIGSFTPASVDPRMAAVMTVSALNHGRLFRFTPAGSTTRPDRSVTVAVRVDGEAARAVSVRSTLAAATSAPGTLPVRIAPTAFNLGVARGYESFAQKLATPTVLRKIDMPDLASFDAGRARDRTARPAEARFAPRIALDETAKPGRLPRTLEGQGDYSVDVGGSYRLTRNLNVTAGVRYSSERDRVVKLADTPQDSQAVYVGTQFHF